MTEDHNNERKTWFISLFFLLVGMATCIWAALCGIAWLLAHLRWVA